LRSRHRRSESVSSSFGVAGAELSEVTRGVMPFLIADFVILGILIVWPEIVLLLPNLM
jgi:TRAP-type C4-dicarboxylate transport system permease large subunit